MNPSRALLGRRVKLVLRSRPLRELVSDYARLPSPHFFERQFGRPVSAIEQVIASAEAALAHGLSSYFDVCLLDTEQVIGHIRVDWSLDGEGLICLHGGSASGTRGQAQARQEGWQLMMMAALRTRGVRRLGTATALSNKPAQAVIAASGFRRTRVLRLTGGQEPMVHYRLVPAWFTPPAALQSLPLAGLDDFRPALQHAEPRPVPELVPLAPPPGWQAVNEANLAHWLLALHGSAWFLEHLASQAVSGAGVQELLQQLRFEAACGTQFLGHNSAGQADGLISLQSLPGRPGWCYLRGGPLRSSCPVEPVKTWLDALFGAGQLERAEAQAPADRLALRDWWLAAGLTEEGVTEVDEQGAALGLALARVAAP